MSEHPNQDAAYAINLAKRAADHAIDAMHRAEQAMRDAADAFNVAKANRVAIGDIAESLGKIARALADNAKCMADVCDTNISILEFLQRMRQESAP